MECGRRADLSFSITASSKPQRSREGRFTPTAPIAECGGGFALLLIYSVQFRQRSGSVRKSRNPTDPQSPIRSPQLGRRG